MKLNRLCIDRCSGVASAGGNYELWNIAMVCECEEQDIVDYIKSLGCTIKKVKSPFYQRAIMIDKKELRAIKILKSSFIEDRTIDMTYEIDEALKTLKMSGILVRRHGIFVFDESSIKALIALKKMLKD